MLWCGRQLKPAYFDKKISTLWLLQIAVFSAMLLLGLKDSLDARLFYNFEQAIGFLNSLNSDMLSRYLKTEILDLFFIVIYSTLLLLSYKKYFTNKLLYKIFPLVPGFFDLIETTNIVLYLQNPERTACFNWLGYITFAKWISIAVVLVWFFIKLRFRNNSVNHN